MFPPNMTHRPGPKLECRRCQIACCLPLWPSHSPAGLGCSPASSRFTDNRPPRVLPARPSIPAGTCGWEGMISGRLQELRAKGAALRQETHVTRKRLQSARKTAARNEKRKRARTTRLEETAKDVATAIGGARGTAAASTFLRRAGHPAPEGAALSTLPSEAGARRSQQSRTGRRSPSPGTLGAVASPASVEEAGPAPGGGSLAAAFSREFLLHDWVRVLNETVGIAPAGPEVWTALLAEDTCKPARAAGALLPPPPNPRRSQQQWLRRWRRRWRVRRARVPPGSGLGRDELMIKAPPFWEPDFSKNGSPGPTTGSKKGAGKRRRFLGPNEKVGRILGPESGPLFGAAGGLFLQFWVPKIVPAGPAQLGSRDGPVEPLPGGPMPGAEARFAHQHGRILLSSVGGRRARVRRTLQRWIGGEQP
jgi:hypothetical protein